MSSAIDGKISTKKERTKCEVYSRIVGYIRPLHQWNKGKMSEWVDRKTYKPTSKQ